MTARAFHSKNGEEKLEEKELDSATREQLKKIIAQNKGKAGALTRVLQQAQGLIGYLPLNVQKFISEQMKLPLNEVYGLASFYSFFTMVPRGKHIVRVCLGTACYIRGGQRIIDNLEAELEIKPGDTTEDGKFSLDVVRCLGCCGLAPIVEVDGNIHRRVSPVKVREILNSYT
jgi:NADH:ubiquinone oxidoreductase subunit E